ncbi:MAG: Peptide deformylase [Candidatus Woesebacteria bacterium GW2011_GWA1_37_8]|uniref:Peptide deformylase n=2 Tax=Candidatus Woeseibacteriota TaxID=1752722 RepID=A0A0G0LEQ5_9BACT|nr:MAG: peptide deformylase [Microgenomates group bacterium GW2011_GWC1_37_12b]KKQ45646.1 MAG: Peptide deformylase [Candidatus Woesebacteria bacterium GW2011_GWA1_37_8]KKQ86425.1 MAG: Peptide deformylase [Candidatus Woesebacteria bacterium GW2011_GWB1_38_8b]
MIRQILDVKQNTLREKSKPVVAVDKKIKELIRDMIHTLEVQKDPEGVGLAASQVGKNLRLFVMKPKDKAIVIMNPEIVTVSKEKNMPKNDSGKKIMEGCLSLPHYYGPLKRANEITIKFLGEDGNIKTQIFKGLAAQIVQHEIDHLNGVLFIDRLLEAKTPLYEYLDGEWEKVDLIM